MPEGPEIRRAADRLRAVVEGEIAQRVHFNVAGLTRFHSRLQGRTVEAIEPHGKALVTRFEGGLNLYSHNQLYGRWQVTRGSEPPRTTRTLKVSIHTQRGAIWLYSATAIEVLSEAQLARHPFLLKLGPDLLARDLAPGQLVERLRERRFSGRSLAALLLDQGFVAGIGNYLRSEMLFVAGLAPSRRARDLDPAQLAALAAAIITVGRRAYKLRGITNEPQRAAQLKLDGVGFEARRFHVFDREGLPCYACGEPIERVEIATRRLYLCRNCQR